MFLDVVVDLHGSDFVEARSDFVCACVVGSIEGFKIDRKKMLLIENGEVKIVESWGIIGGREPKSILEIEDGIIVWREKQELGAFIVETHRARRIVGEDGGNSEYGMTGGEVHMIAGPVLEVRRPVDKSVARELMGPALHIHRQAGLPNLRGWLFIVAVGHTVAGAAMEVRIGWTSKGVREDEM